MLFADFPNSKFWFPEFVSSYAWHVTQQTFSKPCLANLISKDTHLVLFISGCTLFVYVPCIHIFFSEVQELYNLPASQDVTPVSGYIKYGSGTAIDALSISSIQDFEEEGDEVFTVKLLTADGGASVSSTDSAATLTGKAVVDTSGADPLFLERGFICIKG